MQKKIKYVYVTLLILLLLSLALDIIANDKISYLGITYFFTFVCLSIFLISRGLIYKIDTNVYFGLLLLASPLVQTLVTLEIHKYFVYCFGIFLVLWLASFVVWKVFKNDFHKLLSYIFLGEFVIFLAPLSFKNMTIWYLMIMAVVWFVLVLVLNFIITARKHVSKKT